MLFVVLTVCDFAEYVLLLSPPGDVSSYSFPSGAGFFFSQSLQGPFQGSFQFPLFLSAVTAVLWLAPYRELSCVQACPALPRPVP